MTISIKIGPQLPIEPWSILGMRGGGGHVILFKPCFQLRLHWWVCTFQITFENDWPCLWCAQRHCCYFFIFHHFILFSIIANPRSCTRAKSAFIGGEIEWSQIFYPLLEGLSETNKPWRGQAPFSARTPPRGIFPFSMKLAKFFRAENDCFP